MLMYPPGLVRRSPHSFPECISDFAFAGWIPVIGDLQKLLARGEYDPLCPAPLFESNFLQVTKRGELVDVHNRASLVTLGIAATSPALLLPDVMIIARPTERPQGEPLGPKGAHGPPELELTRLIPLELVSLYLHDVGEQRLKLRLATGRVYYLQLCAPRGEERPLFSRWLRLIYLLQAPPGSRASAPSWHSSDLRGHPAKPPPSQRLQPIREEEEPGALMPRFGEPPGSGGRPPTQEQLSRRQRPASPTGGQQPATQSVGGRGAGRLAMPSTASVRRFPSTTQFDGLSRSRAKVADPWMQQSPVSRERSSRSQPYLEGPSKEPSVERSRGQLNVAIRSGEQGGVSSRSQAGSLSQWGPSAASKASVAAGSPERSRASLGVGRSEVATASVGVGRSLPCTASAAAGPSRPGSARLSRMDGQMEPGRRSGERSQAQLGHASSAGEQGGSRSRSQRGSNAASGPPRAAPAPGSHERPSGSVAPSLAEQASSPVAPAPPERPQLSVGVGPSEVATASVAVGPSGQRSRSSRQLGTRSRETSGEGVQGKAQSSSGHVNQKRLSREKGSDSKGKFKSALSSAKHRSSLTFVTLYSALSNSLDKVTGGKLSQRRSREDAKTQLTSKPSKRVTISGVVEMSGQGSPEMSSVAPSTMESKGRSDGEQGPAGSGAALGRESDRLSRAQPGGSRATVGPSSPEKSRASVGVGRSAVATASVGVGRSAVTTASVAADPSRLGSTTVGPSSPEKSRASVGVGRSAVATASVGVGRSAVTTASVAVDPSRLGSTTVGPSSPEKARASVGVGRSAVSTASVGVGRSVVATASVAAGPSRLGSARPLGTDREMEPGRRSREPSAERSQALPGHVSPSAEQGTSRSRSPVGRPNQPGSSAVSGASGTAGPVQRSKVSVAAGPSEKSRVSAAAGPSEMATVSVAVGPSELGPRSSARPSERDRLNLPDGRSSKRGRRRGGQISSPSSTGEAGTPGTVASLGKDGDDMSRGTSKRSRASVAPGSPERSRASVAPGSAEKSSTSRAPGSAEKSRPVAPGSPERSRASVAPGSAERSRASVAAGPSEVAAVSVAVGRSEPGSLSSAPPAGTDVRVPSEGRSWLSSLSSGALLGTEAGDASPGSARRGRSGEQSRGRAREKGGAHSQSPLGRPSQASHGRSAVSVAVGLSKPAVVSVAVGPSGARPSELDRQGELGWGPARSGAARSRSKGRQEDKQDPSVGHPASRGGSDRAATRMKSQ